MAVDVEQMPAIETGRVRPRLAVAMCTCNGAKYIELQLHSILQQTRLPDQVVICDDASTDKTMLLVGELVSQSKVPVKIIQNSSRLGVVANFEQAIAACEADYIALSDQDDIWVEDRLEVFEREILSRPAGECALLYSDLEIIDADGKNSGKTFHGRLSFVPMSGEAAQFLHTRNFIPGCSIMFDARLRDLVLPIPPEAIMHDWWINLTISLVHDIVAVEPSLIKYRLHTDNTVGVANMRYSLKTIWRNGFFNTGFGNSAAVIRQASAVARRLKERGEDCPRSTLQFLQCFSHVPGLRFLSLLPLSVGRDALVTNVWFFIFSGFITRRYLDDSSIPYR